MPILTAITVHPRRPGRFAIAVDGVDVATLSVAAIDRLALRVGMPVTSPLAAAIATEGAMVATLDQALRLLAAHARSTDELRQRLRQKGCPPETIEPALAECTRLGYLDDATFARSFVRATRTSRGFGRRRIAAELARRGIRGDDAAEAIDDVEAEDTDASDASALETATARKLRTLRGLAAPVVRRRLYGYLARRGFAPDAIGRAIDQALRDAAAEDATERDTADGAGADAWPDTDA